MQGNSERQHLRELEAFATKELSQVQRDLGELRLLIRQTTGEVERLTQRTNQAKARQREAESNLDGFGRQDLKNIFDSSTESQLRLLMMQSQLEQLQSRERSLVAHGETLQRTVEAIGSLGVAGHSTAADPSLSSKVIPSACESPSERLAIRRIVQVEEDERSRTVRLIHDGPIQALANVLLRAEICERLMDRDPAAAREELAHLKDVIASNLRDIRRFVFDVRPLALDDLGLLPSLRKYVEGFREKGKPGVELVVVGRERRLDPHVEVTVFRIVQEALQNVAQHASASKAKVLLELEGERIAIVVEDDGIGFDAAQSVARQERITTFGLAGMIGRAEMLGGRLDVESFPGRGTRLTATIPCTESPRFCQY